LISQKLKFGETHGYSGYDFVRTLEKFISRPVDGIICNTKKPMDEILLKYKEQRAEFVEIEKLENLEGNRKIYASDLLDTSNKIVRHDSNKLASLIERIIF
jgi:2-phospho-L-lactate transferase/gluconeogenesis factor (CofD/UPF0052 family)